MERGDTLVDVGPRGGQHPDDRQAELGGQRDEPLENHAFGRADGSPVLPAVEAEEGDVASLEPADGGGGRGAGATGHRQPEREAAATRFEGEGHRGGPTTSVALWPPNPKEFDSTGPCTERGDPAITSRAMS